jgi:hypothetical protein
VRGIALALAVAVGGASIVPGCVGGAASPGGGSGGDLDGGAEPTGPNLGGVLVSEYRAGEGAGGDDVQWGNVSAGFYTGPFPSWHEVTASEGACDLKRPLPPATCASCAGACVAPGHCVPYPTTVSGGTVTLTGLAIDAALATLRPESDGMGGWWYRYGPSSPGTTWLGPPNVFDPGGIITATSTGATAPALNLTATGVAPIAPNLPDRIATFTPGRAFTLRWTPSSESRHARVHVTINSSNTFHGEPLPVIIECDVPDAAGELAVPAAMVDAFPESAGLVGCVRRDCPASALRRYTRATVDVPGGHLELVVADEMPFGVEHHP